MNVKDVMITNVTKISPDNSVRQAAKVMLANHVSGLPVTNDEGYLVGVISEGDLLRRTELGFGAIANVGDPLPSQDERARAYVKGHAWRVADVMSCDLIVVDENAPLWRVAALMIEHGIKRVPVVRGGSLVGIVSRADLLHAVISAKPDGAASGDEAIRRSVMTRLGDDIGLEGMNVTVTVLKGLVHLWGNVETENCRNAARVAAESVRGVRGVVEHFPLQKPATPE